MESFLLTTSPPYFQLLCPRDSKLLVGAMFVLVLLLCGKPKRHSKWSHYAVEMIDNGSDRPGSLLVCCPLFSVNVHC